MGSVWAASKPNGRRAAVKVMNEAMAFDDRARTRFVREAELAERVRHPSLAQVLERGETEEGIPYFALELLVGETVEARRQRKGGKLPEKEVLWVADRTLAALAALHHHGVVHRDVKPENLFMTTGGELKLLDLGIARDAAGGLTAAGSLLGTVAFMAPEQARGDLDEVDVQTDLWGVGATMYTLLSGRFIRSAGDLRALLRAAAWHPVPPLSEVAPEVSRELADLVDFVLSFDKKQRWPSAAAMRRGVRMAYSKLERANRPSRPTGDADDDEASFDPSSVQEIPPPGPAEITAGAERALPPTLAATSDTVVDSPRPARRDGLAPTVALNEPPPQPAQIAPLAQPAQEQSVAPPPAPEPRAAARAWLVPALLAALVVAVAVAGVAILALLRR
jgi:serine/threonine-protein kinase